MSYNNGAKIITEGLTVYLDSQNSKSYPGSGTTWYDLSGNNNNGTMTNMNSPSTGNTSGFDTTTGYMMFDRHLGSGDGTSNNVVTIANSTSLKDCLCSGSMTVEFWFKETSYVCTALTKWDSSWEIYYCSGLVFRTQGTSGGSDISTGIASSPGTWRHIVCTHSGILADTYINGTLVSSVSNTPVGQNTTNVVSVGAYSNGTYACNGSFPVYKLYNRVLTPTEVLRNYNATKGRFRL
jgi:hypothetical protein